MSIKEMHNVYFLGIGGIGMSALARWFQAEGYNIAGYDRSVTSLTAALENEGMALHFEDDVKKIPPAFLNKKDTLIVYTPAIPKDHTELNFFLKEGFTMKKRAAVLGLLSEGKFVVAIAGTHGKTTTSSMVAHVLKHSGKDCTAFLGGITINYNSNLLLSKKKDGKAIVVLEADEYDRSFMTLFPDITVITSMDADHLDIYGDEKEFINTFNDFIRQIKPGGYLLYRDIAGNSIEKDLQVESVSFGSDSGEIKAENIRIENGISVFDVIGKKIEIKDVLLNVPGYHNIENALAAIGVAEKLGIDASGIKAAVGAYKGVKRRFEYIVKNENIVYIDDYAHHPTELEALLTSVRAWYKGKKVTIIFQPHLFSRTRDFFEGFAEKLAIADQLVLLEIYPAREFPIPGVTSQVLLDKVPLKEKILCSKADLLALVGTIDTDVLITAGAGDIDQFINPIKESLLNRKYV